MYNTYCNFWTLNYYSVPTEYSLFTGTSSDFFSKIVPARTTSHHKDFFSIWHCLIRSLLPLYLNFY